MPEDTDLFDPQHLQADQGAVEMVLFAHQGKVVQRFRERMLYVLYEPHNAVAIGKKLIDCAVDCGAQVEIKVPRREISKQKRDALVVRCRHLLRSLEEGCSPAYVARAIVDSLLSAVD